MTVEELGSYRALLVIDDWPDQVVEIVAETPSHYRVRSVAEALRLPLRNNGLRLILRSGTWLVPKHQIRMIWSQPSDERTRP